MEDNKEFYTLNNGTKMPKLGMGLFSLKPDSTEETIFEAITKLGVRHLDTAKIYENEEIVGKALKRAFEAGIKREEMYVTSMLWIDDRISPETALKESMKKL